MPIPGSVITGLAFNPANIGAVGYPSLCTFLSKSESQNASGQEVHTFTAIDAAHTNIPCRKSPLLIIRPRQQEEQRGDFQMSDAKEQVNLNKYVADASNEWQITVDGITYEILAVERDGNSLTTRVGIGKVVPFNA